MRILLVLWGMTPALVEAVSIGSDVALHKGEDIMMCPLTANVKDTHHSIIVKHFHDPPDSIPDEVFKCYWGNNVDEPECFSRYNFTLKGQLTDLVMAKVPESRRRDKGTYKVQLLPHDESRPFTLCGFFRVSDTDKEENVAVTDTPVVSSTAAKRSTPSHESVERETLDGWDEAVEGKITAILVLLIVLILLILITPMVILYFLHQRKALRSPTSSTASTISTEQKSMIKKKGSEEDACIMADFSQGCVRDKFCHQGRL